MVKLRVFLIVLFILFIGAVCTPQQAAQSLGVSQEQQESTDYALVIDRSGSMRVGGRFSEAQTAAKEFVDQLIGDDRVSVVGFDSRSVLYSTFRSNKQSVKDAINRMTIGDWTQYQQGLLRAYEEFVDESTSSSKIIVFMSDGRPDDDPQELQEAIDTILADDICIYTIAYASQADEEAQETLASIAQQSQQETGCGEYFRTQEDSYELRRIYRQIYLETASEQALSVDVQVNATGQLRMQVGVGALQGAGLSACFEPEISVVVTRDDKVVFEDEGADTTFYPRIPQGNYTYEVIARETCGGQCSYFGLATDNFAVSAGEPVCDSSFSQIATAVRSSANQEVVISSSGASRSLVRTDGIVSFENARSQPITLLALDQSFESKEIQPGQNWRYAFETGLTNVTDIDESFMVEVSRQTRSVSNTSPVDTVLVLDTSGSMAGQPLQAAKDSFQSLVSYGRVTDRFGIVSFSNTAHSISSLSADTQLLSKRIQALRSGGATAYSQGLREAAEVLLDSRNSRRGIIFVSDGAPTDLIDESILTELIKKEVCIYTVAFGAQGVYAVDALRFMTNYSQQALGCGLFIQAGDDTESLAAAIGQSFAHLRGDELVFESIQTTAVSTNQTRIQTNVKSRYNNVQIPSDSAACIVPAEVYVLSSSGDKTRLSYTGDAYEAVIDTAKVPGAMLTARVVDESNPVRVLTASHTFSSSQKSSVSWQLVLVVAFVLFAAYIFITGILHVLHES